MTPLLPDCDAGCGHTGKNAAIRSGARPIIVTRRSRRLELLLPTLADVEALTGLKTRTFIETYEADSDPATLASHLARAFSMEAVTRQLKDRNAATWWLLDESLPVGYLKVNRGAAQTEPGLDDGLELEQIYLLRRHHGLGLGRRLLEHAIGLADDDGSAFLWLSVWEHNGNAISLYHRFGFRPFDEHIFLYGDEEQRDLLMRLDL
jgi:ribosomal protein S18 acetylase RimI-like enzyme